MGDITLTCIATHKELDARFDDYKRSLGSVVSKVKGTFKAIHSITDTVNSLNNATRTLTSHTDSNSQLLAKEQHFTIFLAQTSLSQPRVR